MNQVRHARPLTALGRDRLHSRGRSHVGALSKVIAEHDVFTPHRALFSPTFSPVVVRIPRRPKTSSFAVTVRTVSPLFV